jgi:Ca2+:H+ antiporter
MSCSSPVQFYGDEDSGQNDEDDDDDDTEDLLGFKYGLFWLAVITTIIAFLSDEIVDTISGAANSMNLHASFVAGIIVPIVGNASEHAVSILFAGKNKVNLVLGVALGSGVQIGVMVLPLLVVLGWIAGKEVTLAMGVGDSVMYLWAVMLVTIVLKDGKSNWFSGAALVATYFAVTATFWFHKPEILNS